MGMTTKVIAYISPDNEKYKKHAKVLLACHEAGIKELPEETAKYFNTKEPDPYYLEEILEKRITTHEFYGDMVEGFEVFMDELPKDIYKIRFINSY